MLKHIFWENSGDNLHEIGEFSSAYAHCNSDSLLSQSYIDKGISGKYFYNFSTKTYVVGTH